jgi:hypothetical protein
MSVFSKVKLLSLYSVLALIILELVSCTQYNNNNNSSNPTLQSQVVGNWKLVKEHWQLSNNNDTVITSWSTLEGAVIPPTIEFGNQILGPWYSGGADRMSWGGPVINPFTRGNIQVDALWAIDASTNRLIGAAYASYDIVHIDANSMILSQEGLNNQYSFDTLWLEKL